jgi:hypothetical protein
MIRNPYESFSLWVAVWWTMTLVLCGMAFLMGGLMLAAQSAAYVPAANRHPGSAHSNGALDRTVREMGPIGEVGAWIGGFFILAGAINLAVYFLNRKFDWF